VKNKIKLILVAMALFGVVFSVPVASVKAQTSTNQCSASLGGNIPTFTFQPGGGGTSGSIGANGHYTVTGTYTCCCNANTVTPDSFARWAEGSQCPDGCFKLEGNYPVRSDFLPQPGNPNFNVDATSKYYPLKGVSDLVSKWYAAAFYIAVVLAIIQIFRGGIEYSISAGNSSKSEEAKDIIIEAVIGLGVALLSAGIMVFLRGPGIFVFTP